jgi:hypothetical protein
MAVKVKKIVLWRGVVDNVPGALARTLAPLAGSNLEILMGYHLYGQTDRAVVEAYPVSGKRAAASAASVGLAAATLPALLVQGDDRPGLGHATAQALGEAGININFLVAQVVRKQYTAVFGFSSDEDAQRAAALIKKAAAKTTKKKSRR